MKWNLEELTEDAVVAYLKTKCGDQRISAAWELDEPQYPRAVVHVASTEPVSDPSEWHDARMLAVEVAVQTEAAHELGTDNAIVRTARERNAVARSEVAEALFVSDLKAQLIAQGVAGVAFSMAQFATTQRSNEGRYLVTVFAGLVIAEPVTGS